MGSQAGAWEEGYHTALHDFGIQVTEKDITERVSKNPHARREGRTRLSEFERFEIRHALGYHFNDCLTPEFEDQAMIIETIVERILTRRPERAS